MGRSFRTVVVGRFVVVIGREELADVARFFRIDLFVPLVAPQLLLLLRLRLARGARHPQVVVDFFLFVHPPLRAGCCRRPRIASSLHATLVPHFDGARGRAAGASRPGMQLATMEQLAGTVRRPTWFNSVTRSEAGWQHPAFLPYDGSDWGATEPPRGRQGERTGIAEDPAAARRRRHRP